MLNFQEWLGLFISLIKFSFPLPVSNSSGWVWLFQAHINKSAAYWLNVYYYEYILCFHVDLVCSHSEDKQSRWTGNSGRAFVLFSAFFQPSDGLATWPGFPSFSFMLLSHHVRSLVLACFPASISQQWPGCSSCRALLPGFWQILSQVPHLPMTGLLSTGSLLTCRLDFKIFFTVRRVTRWGPDITFTELLGPHRTWRVTPNPKIAICDDCIPTMFTAFLFLFDGKPNVFGFGTTCWTKYFICQLALWKIETYF